jgi:DNA-binding LacI/PurR family transcriptional regulator
MDTIGVVAVVDGNELNLYFLEVLNGILEVAARERQNTTVLSIDDWVADESRILEFCDGRVDGIIGIGSRLTSEFVDILQSRIPFVSIHGNVTLPGTYDLDVDSEQGAYQVVRYLIEQGHRRILHISGGRGLSGAEQRLAGYRHALKEASIAFDDDLVVHAGFSQNAGRYAMRLVLAGSTMQTLPTAVFCASDAIASGCLEVLAEGGLRVPEDISVAGFDDTFNARMTAPPLTTARQPFRRLGQRAVELLLLQIRQGVEEVEVSGAPHIEIFPVELVVRHSVAAPTATPKSLPWGLGLSQQEIISPV